MKFILKTVAVAFFLVILSQSAFSQSDIKNPQPTLPKEEITIVELDDIKLDRDYIDHKIFIDEKSVSSLPTEIKLKRLKKYKNSLMS